MKLTRKTLPYIILIVAIAVLGALFIHRIFRGVSITDEPFNIAIAARVARGDLPFIDARDEYLCGDIFMTPFIWVYEHLTGGGEGIVLAARFFYLFLNIGVAMLAFFCLRGILGNFGAIASGVMIVFCANSSLYYLWYDTAALIFLLAGGLLQIRQQEIIEEQKSESDTSGMDAAISAVAQSDPGTGTTAKTVIALGIAAGILHAFACVAYPIDAGVIVAVFLILVIMSIKAHDVRPVVSYTIGGAIIAVPGIIALLILGPDRLSFLMNGRIGDMVRTGAYGLLRDTWHSVRSCIDIVYYLIPLFIVFLCLFYIGKRNNNAVFKTIALIGMVANPLFFYKDIIACDYRSVNILYFYMAMLVVPIIMMDREFSRQCRNIYFLIFIPAAVKFLSVAFNTAMHNHKAIIGFYTAGILGAGMFVRFAERALNKAMISVLIIILLATAAVVFYRGQFFDGEMEMEDCTVRMEEGALKGLYVPPWLEEDVLVEKEAMANVGHDESVAILQPGWDYTYLHISCPGRIKTPYVSSRGFDGMLEYWESKGYPDVVLVPEECDYFLGVPELGGVVERFYTEDYSSDRLTLLRRKQ